MAKKPRKKSSKQPVKKPARKPASKPKAAVARKSPSARRSSAKAGKQLGKLSAAKLSSLKKIDSSGEFSSMAALNLDHALFVAVYKELGDHFNDLRKMSLARAGFWAARCLEGEVRNGGFHQFFSNMGPVPVAIALEFHTQYGPADVAKLLARAIKALPGGRIPVDYDAMMDVMCPEDLREDKRLTNALDKITDKFFDRTGPSLLETRLKFVLSHEAEFFA